MKPKKNFTNKVKGATKIQSAFRAKKAKKEKELQNAHIRAEKYRRENAVKNNNKVNNLSLQHKAQSNNNKNIKQETISAIILQKAARKWKAMKNLKKKTENTSQNIFNTLNQNP